MERTFAALYTALLKDHWQEVVDEKLTVSRHFVGAAYQESRFRLMVVGRAMNGWGTDFSACGSPEAVAETTLSMRSPFYDIVHNDSPHLVSDDGKTTYRYSRSAFWRTVQKLLQKCGESEGWYNDPKGWNERVVWSNLFKLSPRNSGNPSWRLVRNQLPTYIELLKAEINACEPKHVLFITDWDFLEHYPKQPERSFAKALHIQPQEDRGGIVGTGHYAGASIVVCKRPEFHSGGEDALVQSIYEAFEELDKLK